MRSGSRLSVSYSLGADDKAPERTEPPPLRIMPGVDRLLAVALVEPEQQHGPPLVSALRAPAAGSV